MHGMSRRAGLSLALIAGLALAAAAAAHAGLSAVAEVLAGLGAGELAVLSALQMGSVLLCGIAWHIFERRTSLLACCAARFIRDGTSSVLSIVPGTGEVAGARALTLFGARGGDAAGSAVVDLATEILAQILFTLAGVVALVAVLGPSELDHAIAIALAALVPVAAAVLVGRSERTRTFLSRSVTAVAKALGMSGWSIGRDAVQTVRSLWADRPKLVAGTLVHLAAWMIAAVQIWATAIALDAPLSPLASLALASLVHAAKGALFMVPWSAGVQEVGFAVAGAALGLDGPTAIAMSLAFRVRDTLLAIPALLLWGALEAREVWIGRKADAAEAAGAQTAKAKSRPGAASSSARV